MDTQPLSSPQVDQSVPLASSTPSTQPLPNNHVLTIVSAVLLVLIGAVGVYFIITNSGKFSLTQKPTQTVPAQAPIQEVLVNETPDQPEDNSQQIRNFTVYDIKKCLFKHALPN